MHITIQKQSWSTQELVFKITPLPIFTSTLTTTPGIITIPTPSWTLELTIAEG